MSKLFPSILPGDDRGHTPATTGDDDEENDEEELQADADALELSDTYDEDTTDEDTETTG